MSYPVIPDLFESIVSSVSTALGSTVFFHHGHILEISNTVKQMAEDPDTDKRYPLIALKQDVDNLKHGINGLEFDATIYIITLSDPNYTAKDRLTNIFKPILTPIFDKFIEQTARSGYFLEQTINEVREKTTFTEHYFWGRAQIMGNEANIFGDWVDCIEIKSMKLTAMDSCSDSVISTFAGNYRAEDPVFFTESWEVALTGLSDTERTLQHTPLNGGGGESGIVVLLNDHPLLSTQFTAATDKLTVTTPVYQGDRITVIYNY